MTNDRSDFTQGSILKKLTFFMIPILGALVLQAAYGAVDLLVVGRFGSTQGLSGVSTGSQVLNLVTFVVTQLAMGITVLIARYMGEKKTEQIEPQECEAEENEMYQKEKTGGKSMTGLREKRKTATEKNTGKNWIIMPGIVVFTALLAIFFFRKREK